MKKKFLLALRHWVKAFIYPRPLIGFFFLPKFWIDLVAYRGIDRKTAVPLWDLQPCLGDWTVTTPFDPHYFYQGAWLARRLKLAAPSKHVDIASSVLTISVLSAFVDTTFVDYRPLKVTLVGLDSIPGDILHLPFEDNTLASLSCLHVIEHIGLGRYGDPMDPEGSVKAAAELERVLKNNGELFVSLPVGRERTCFNAHRVHDPNTVLTLFPQLSLINFSYVDDAGTFHENTDLKNAQGLDFGCGLFHFKKV
jgi:SAM-dependent methyltransferase